MGKFLTQFSGSPTDQKKGIGCQKWDNNVTFTMKGKKIVIRDYVQENADGTDFYKNLENFGNLETTIEFMSKNRAELVQDFKEAISLRNLEDQRLKLLNIWERLPAEIRATFDNDFSNFMTNGAAFFDEQAKIIQEQIKNEELAGEAQPNNGEQTKETQQTQNPTE